MEAREKINNEQLECKSFVEKLNNAKRVTVGICYKSGTNRLGKDVFAICKESVDKKKSDLMEKMKRDQEAYLKLKREADDLIAAKPIEKFGNKDLNIMMRYLRRDEDKKLLTKKNEMMKLYNSWKDREPLSFQIEEAKPVASNIDNDEEMDHAVGNKVMV